MLNIRFDIDGDDELIRALNRLGGNSKRVVQRGLKIAAAGVFREAHYYLSGAGAKKSNIAPGSYPVPVRTGNLRNLLFMVPPGKTFSNEAGSVTAGLLEALIGDSAEYADVIHEGTWSSGQYGERPYLQHGLEKFDDELGIENTMQDELEKEIKKVGLHQ